MIKRLQSLLDESELQDIRHTSPRERMTVAEWVRPALREARRREPEREVHEKLDALRQAAEHGFPTDHIGQMLAEIERGYSEPSGKPIPGKPMGNRKF